MAAGSSFFPASLVQIVALLKSLSEVLTIFQILRLWKPLGSNYGVMLKQLLVVILS